MPSIKLLQKIRALYTNFEVRTLTMLASSACKTAKAGLVTGECRYLKTGIAHPFSIDLEASYLSLIPTPLHLIADRNDIDAGIAVCNQSFARVCQCPSIDFGIFHENVRIGEIYRGIFSDIVGQART